MSAFALLCALAVCALPPQRELQATSLQEVELEASFTWPTELQRGYFPIRIELDNRGEREAKTRVTAKQMQGLDEVEKRIALAPGERVRFDLLCRAERSSDDQYFLEFEVNGELVDAGLLGTNRAERKLRRAALVLSAERRTAEIPESWGTSLSGIETDFAAAAFDDMPDRHEAWSSLDMVFLDTARGLPTGEQFRSLLAWTRLGGTLILYGPRCSTELSASTAIDAWREPRFMLDEALEVGGRAYAFAQGRLVTLDQPEPLEPQAVAQFVADQLEGEDATPGWTPGVAEARSEAHAPAETPAPALPLRALAAILVLFTLLIGPANFYMVKRLKKPVVLLLSVPGIALLTGLLLLSYGVLAQGLDVKVARNSFTVLDQRQRQVSTAGVMRVFAGMSPGRGLRPEPGTSVFVPRTSSSRGRRRYEQSFRIDLTQGVLMAGDYLPVRQVFDLLALTDGPARARLEVVAKVDGPEIANGLGAEIEGLVLRGAGGEWYRLDAPLAEGASVALSRCEASDAAHESDAILAAVLPGGPRELPVGCYAARLAGAPFADDLGVEFMELSGEHMLFGVLPAGEGEGR